MVADANVVGQFTNHTRQLKMDRKFKRSLLQPSFFKKSYKHLKFFIEIQINQKVKLHYIVSLQAIKLPMNVRIRRLRTAQMSSGTSLGNS